MFKVLPSDQSLSYQLLFIKDVKTATLHSSNPTMYETRNKRLFQRVRLNGIIVAEQRNDSTTEVGNSTCCIIHLDDSTETIQVHIPSRLFKRKDSDKIKIATSITVIGEPKHQNNTMIIICKGFQIEPCLMAGIEHWLNVMKSNKDKKWLQSQPKNINTLIENETDPNNSNDHASKRQKLITTIKEEGKEEEEKHNIFKSLSSQPSPIRGPIQEFLFSSSKLRPSSSQLSQNSLPNDINDQLDISPSWHWSPDNIVATSTPIRQLLNPSSNSNSPLLYRSSPLNDIIRNNFNDDDNDDDFGFDDDNSAFGRLDLGDLERIALERIQKEEE